MASLVKSQQQSYKLRLPKLGAFHTLKAAMDSVLLGIKVFKIHIQFRSHHLPLSLNCPLDLSCK